jgi:general secretion pathway protein A
MYTGFFGLNEQPFSISPNPDYLYMSYRHKEALAHLNHGLGDSGGFVLLTGEVGTGKTTVSRCMLAQLPESTDVAFILNPTLSELELLGTICDEFRIRFKRSDATLKMLTDKIKNRLLKNHSNGKNTILIIDEAQHLKTEVLEQLRLLTNLETNTKKLLQIILIGQPELQQLLKRQELRQLAQRITARYHLLPLTIQEIGLYIQHRLRVAGCERPIFDPKAIKLIHQLTKGIPRLINLLSDRSLMGAYATQSPFVNKTIVKQAASEILALEMPQQANHWKWLPVPLLAALAIAAVVIMSTSETTQSVIKTPTATEQAPNITEN